MSGSAHRGVEIRASRMRNPQRHTAATQGGGASWAKQRLGTQQGQTSNSSDGCAVTAEMRGHLFCEPVATVTEVLSCEYIADNQ